jgi:uncharacterized protein
MTTPPNLLDVLQNRVLIYSLVAWGLAQIIKVPIDYLRTRKWNWALLLTVGGMPSSHSALVTSIAVNTGLRDGFASTAFAIAAAIAMVVVYDSTGVRRQAGIHAQKINVLVNELLAGHPISDRQLLEVLGHTPREAIAGVLWAIMMSLLLYYWWG